MTTPQFVHLRTHTEYSLMDGLLRVKSFTKTVAEREMPAAAITDQSNLFATIKFYKSALEKGIKPIIGADLWLYNPQKPNQPYSLIFLCEDRVGYQNLCQLISRSYEEGQVQGLPMIRVDWLPQCNEGLIVLSGAMRGPLSNLFFKDNPKAVEQALTEWSLLFPHSFYLEIQRIGKPDEEAFIAWTLKLSETYQLPVVATNDVRFLDAEDFEAHEARCCIHSGHFLEDSARPKLYTPQQYLRSKEEMVLLFKDIPEAIENTVEIAKRCNLTFNLDEFHLPVFPTPNQEPVQDYLTQAAEMGLLKRLNGEPKPDYQARLRQEMTVINKMGFAGYFLIVADFIAWAKQQKIPVGPGRGSGAGSLVAYALGITELDPITSDLLFERFLNPERISMPDFDIDFCMEGRDKVIEYVEQKYGSARVSQIITYGHMAAKAVVRDVGRVLGYPYGFVDKIAKWIPFELGITLDKALDETPLLSESYQNDEKVKVLLDLARKLEGLARNAGKHAGGIVIAPNALIDFMPLYFEENGSTPVSQFDKDDVETLGLVKFDFLGLRTLTIIDWTLQTIPPLNIIELPLDDQKTLELIQSGKTTAIFQLESRGMKDLVVRLKPDCFNDLVALVALFRPGVLQSGMIDDFINRKHGKAEVDYPHPELEPILKPTYGVILYQEQVMQIAQILGGYTLGKADLLRRAMGKKKAEEMAKHREFFLQGAQQKNVSDETANYIFDLMEKFAGYGFNKSHSVAYALLSYQTAWLKAHYPAAFMAAVLSSDMDNTDKLVGFIDECKNMRLAILPPNVNQSHYAFKTEDDQTILYGLGAIKGVGQNAAEQLVAEREKNGTYRDLFDLCERVDLSKLNRRVLESLIKSGAVDSLGPSRATLTATLAKAMSLSSSTEKNNAGQLDLFGLSAATNQQEHTFVEATPWTKLQRLKAERETLGLYLTGHPIEFYEAELSKLGATRINELNQSQRIVKVAGIIDTVKTLKTKKGDRMAFLGLVDKTNKIEVVIFSDLYLHVQALLSKDSLVMIEGEVSIDSYSNHYKLTAKNIVTLEQARNQATKHLHIHVASREELNTLANTLKETLKPYLPGRCPIHITYPHDPEPITLQLGEKWLIRPADELLLELTTLLGDNKAAFVY